MNLLIITGASSGIGLETARRFAADGDTVINLSRRECPLDSVTHIPCDLGVPDFADKIGAQLREPLEQAQRITLVHNASRFANDRVDATPSDHFRQVMEINLVAPNTLNQLVIPFMGAGSSIFYVGSTLSEKAVPGVFTYSISKHALIGMMRATCQDLAGRGIHTACICPGFTDTEMLRQHVPADAMPSIAAMSTFGRLIESAEIAETLHWAAHHPVINGAVLHANLGQIER